MPRTRRPETIDENLDDAETAAGDQQGDVSGWGEMVAALVLIGTLLLMAWMVAATGLIEDDVAPTIPDDLGVEAGEAG